MLLCFPSSKSKKEDANKKKGQLPKCLWPIGGQNSHMTKEWQAHVCMKYKKQSNFSQMASKYYYFREHVTFIKWGKKELHKRKMVIAALTAVCISSWRSRAYQRWRASCKWNTNPRTVTACSLSKCSDVNTWV